jgi:hypothetical protein
MKIVIRTVDGTSVRGGRALILCDEHGVLLPGQSAIAVEQDDDGRSLVTVSFEIDGQDVILDGTPTEG